MRHPKRPISFPKYVAALVGQPDNWPLAVGALVLIILSNALSSALGEWQLWNFSGNLIIIIVAGVAILVLYLVMKGRNPPVDVGIEIEEKPPTGKAGLTLKALEALHISDALRRHGGNRKKAAEELGINPSTLFRKIRSFGIAIPEGDGRNQV